MPSYLFTNLLKGFITFAMKIQPVRQQSRIVEVKSLLVSVVEVDEDLRNIWLGPVDTGIDWRYG